MSCCRRLVLIGGSALVVGALLPWINWACPRAGAAVFQAGYESAGTFSGSIGLLLVGMALTKRGRPGSRYSLTGVTLAACAISIAAEALWGASTNISEVMADGDAGVVASVGVGIYFSLAGALLAEGGSFWRVSDRP